MRDIRWKGLYDKNSDIQYAPRQLIPKSYYEQHFERREDNRAQKFRKLLDGAKKKLIFKLFTTEKDIQIHPGPSGTIWFYLDPSG